MKQRQVMSLGPTVWRRRQISRWVTIRRLCWKGRSRQWVNPAYKTNQVNSLRHKGQQWKSEGRPRFGAENSEGGLGFTIGLAVVLVFKVWLACKCEFIFILWTDLRWLSGGQVSHWYFAYFQFNFPVFMCGCGWRGHCRCNWDCWQSGWQ